MSLTDGVEYALHFSICWLAVTKSSQKVKFRFPIKKKSDAEMLVLYSPVLQGRSRTGTLVRRCALLLG